MSTRTRDRVSTWQVLRELPPHGKLLVVGVGINRAASFLQIFLVLYLTTGRGWPAAQAGAALSLYGAGSIAGLVAGGAVADRFGCRFAVVASMLGSGLCVGLLPVTSSRPAVLALCALAGAAAQVFRPAAMTLLAEGVPPERLVLAAAGYRLGLNVGALITPLVGAALAGRHYPLLFAVDAASSLVFGLLAWRALPPRLVPPGTPVHERTASPWRDRAFVTVCLGLLLIAAVESQYLAALPLEIVDRGLPTAFYAGLVTLNGLLVISCEPLLTQWLQRVPPGLTMGAGVAMIGLGQAAYGLPGPWAVLIAATVLWTAGETIGAPPAAAWAALAGPAGSRARYVGLSGAAQGLGYAVGPVVGLAVFARDPAVLWAGCAVVGLVAAACCHRGATAEPNGVRAGGAEPPAGGSRSPACRGRTTTGRARPSPP